MSTTKTPSCLIFKLISRMTNLCIKCLKSEIADSGVIYGQFQVDALSPGQSITIGTILRRVLLADLNGIAITGVRIAGVNNEFSIIEGIREDVLELLLNLRGIIVKNLTDDTDRKFGRLKVQGPSVITANAIQLPSGLEIINQNHYIATISRSMILEMEFKFEQGVGYKLADQTNSEDSSDFLEIDAVFMPIQKVDFKVENVYDSTKHISENLIIDIWTNGSILPETALYEASNIVIQFFNSLVENKFKKETLEIVTEDIRANSETHTNISIEELQLSVRSYNCLKRAQINSISDLLKYSPEKLQEIKNFGQKSADEVFNALKNKLGITLK